jgi:hypothetical protein
MGYVIAAIIVVLLIAGFIVFLVTNSARKSNVSDSGAPGAEQNPTAIVGSDSETPLGDTSQHADAPEGSPVPAHDDRPDVARPVDGGEGEGRRGI